MIQTSASVIWLSFRDNHQHVTYYQIQHMPIVNHRAINKRDQLITLDTGTIISVTVEQIFRVNFYMDELVVGYLHFESLSSLNNLEMRPLYKLRDASFAHPALAADADALREAGMALYQSYTNGKILMNKPQQAES